MENKRTKYDIGYIFREFGQDYEKRHLMRSEQRKVLRAIASCRTAVLGGHKLKCPKCGYEEISYNSCRNNNCPKCQNSNRMKWVEKRTDELLPVPYFHLIFTISDFFNHFHFSDYRILYNAIFKTASGTLLHFFKKAGGVPAITATAHSWGQTMCVHPHVHMLVSGGCLSFDRQRWISIGNNYLFNVKELSAEFKRRFMKQIKKEIAELDIPNEEHEKEWVVFCKKPFAGAEVVLKYLSRYIKRSAISNSRITNISSTAIVTFQYKNYRKEDSSGKPHPERMSMPADKFIQRFLWHIPPDNFRRIRFYGILGGSNAKEKLAIAKHLTTTEYFELQSETIECPKEIKSDHQCPKCKLTSMKIIEAIPPTGPPHIVFRNEIPGDCHVA